MTNQNLIYGMIIWDIEKKPSRNYFSNQFTPLIPKSIYNLNIRKTQIPLTKSKKNRKDKK